MNLNTNCNTKIWSKKTTFLHTSLHTNSANTKLAAFSLTQYSQYLLKIKLHFCLPKCVMILIICCLELDVHQINSSIRCTNEYDFHYCVVWWDEWCEKIQVPWRINHSKQNLRFSWYPCEHVQFGTHESDTVKHVKGGEAGSHNTCNLVRLITFQFIVSVTLNFSK